jgi:outer membrane biosynthesis protein TonB
MLDGRASSSARFEQPSGNPGKERLRLGMILSGVLHLLVAAFLIFGLPQILPPPPQIEEPIAVELAQISDKTSPPPPQTKAEQPQPKPEPPKVDAPKPPKPQPAPPPPPPPPPTPKPQAEIPVPDKKPAPPQPSPEQKQLAEIKPQKKPPPPQDEFKSLLRSVEQLRKQDSPPDPTPQPQQQVAAAAQTVHSTLSDQTSQPTMSEKDFLATQIERCWNFDPGARDAGNMIVQVHILIQPDGTVTDSTLRVDQARYASDTFFRAAADSARRAPLACSPLPTPPGHADFFRTYSDITLNFDPRSLVR